MSNVISGQEGRGGRSVKDTIKGYNDNLYDINQGIFNLEDLSFTPGDVRIKEMKNFGVRYDHYDYLKGTACQYIEHIDRHKESKITYFYDEENPFYDILDTYIGKKERIQTFSPAQNGYHILNNNSGEFKVTNSNHTQVQMIKIESGVLILTIPYMIKTFFYYPGDESIVELDEVIFGWSKTELGDVVVVTMGSKYYLYNVFTHDRIEMPENFFTNGIVVIVPSQNYIDIDIYVVEYNEYGIYN